MIGNTGGQLETRTIRNEPTVNLNDFFHLSVEISRTIPESLSPHEKP